MKKLSRLFLFFGVIISLCLAVGGLGLVAKESAFATTGTMTAKILTGEDVYLDETYLDVFSIPTEKFKYSNNGGERAPLDYAFDRNFNTQFSSQESNTTGADAFYNYIDIEFDKAYTLKNIIYQSDGWYSRGFPIQWRIFSLDDSQPREVGYIKFIEKSEESTEKMLFTFNNSFTAKKIRLQWEAVTSYNAHYITAKEIIFLTEETSEGQTLLELFNEYNNLTLNESVNSKEKIEQLREKAKAFPGYESSLNELLTRADQILDGIVKFDPKREFSTADDAQNKLERNGDITSYMRNTLKIKWLGTNRRSTGISVSPGQTLTIYVEADEGDKLPKLAYTQFWGHWSSWNSGEYQLVRGKNVITARSFINEKYSKSVIPGGPVYLVNNYTIDEQSSNVKVYIEGGTLFPVFKMGGDEQRYLNELQDYVEQVNANPSQIINMTEMESNRVLMTVRATEALRIYSSGKSPEQNLQNWNEYFGQILAFEGIAMQDGEEHYDKKNDYVNCNIRLMQPHGAAYAYTEHVGIQEDWESTAIFGGGYGWGYTHELGHMMEIGEREIGECTNNVISKFYETAVDREASRGDFDKTLQNLSGDDNVPVSFFEDGERMNFLLWWLVESYSIGFWGRLENCYRYEDAGGLKGTEKMVYYSSLAAKIDLSYYYERWGFSLSPSTEPYFKAEGASELFKELMQTAKSEGKISDIKPKFWYLDRLEYLENLENHMELYSDNDEVSISNIVNTGDGHYLFFSTEKMDNPAHLGFEIIEGKGSGAKVVGFTHSDKFLDTTKYSSGYTPEYTVIAYDRALKTSKPAKATKIVAQEGVVRLNNQMYNTLTDAIIRASSGDTIYLLKDFLEGGIIIDKDIKITLDSSVSSSITILKDRPGDMFKVLEGVTLEIIGDENRKIILDGNKLTQTGTLINTLGLTKLKYVTLQNNINQKEGGAILTTGTGARKSYLECDFVEFINNSSKSGGAVFNNNATVQATLNDCLFEGNISDEQGALTSRGTFTLTRCSFANNISYKYGGAISNFSGGVMKLDGCDITSNFSKQGGGLFIDGNTTIENTTITYNIGQTGGGIYFQGVYDARSLNLDKSTTLIGNEAEEGAAIYSTGNIANVLNATIKENDSGDGFGIYAKRGSFKIDGQSTIEDNIYRGAEATILLVGSVFNGEKEVLLGADGLAAGTTLLNSSGFSFTEQDAQKFSVKTGVTKASENGGQIVAAIEKFVVTIAINGENETYEISNGNSFVLAAMNVPTGKYIEKFTSGGEDYELYQTITVNKAVTFNAVLKDSAKVTLDVKGEKEEIFVTPRTYFNLPAESSQNVKILSWQSEEKTYFPHASVLINASQTFVAQTNNLIEVTFMLNSDLVEKQYYSYGDYLILPHTVNVERGKEVDRWVSGEQTIEAGHRITTSMTISAVLRKQRLSVDYVYSTGEANIGMYKSTIVEFGDTINVERPTDIPVGHEFSKLTYNGEDIAVGQQITIEENTVITVLLTIDQMDITYSFNGEAFSWQVDYGTEYEIAIIGEMPVGKEIDCILVNGERKQEGDIIVLTEDTQIEVKLKSIVYEVVFMVNNEVIETKLVAYGDDFILSVPNNIPEGYVFDHFEMGGQNQDVGTIHKITARTIVDVILREVPASDNKGELILMLSAFIGTAVVVSLVAVVSLLVVGKKKKKNR